MAFRCPIVAAVPIPIKAIYDSRVDALWNMAQELGVPPAEAVRMIDQAMFSSLLRKGNLDADRWRAASMRRAAKRRTERAK